MIYIESITWSWKTSRDSGTSGWYPTNPLHGVERENLKLLIWCSPHQWIHYMELKEEDCVVDTVAILDYLNPLHGVERSDPIVRFTVHPSSESITWSWKISGEPGILVGPPGIHYMELKGVLRCPSRGASWRCSESITWSWKKKVETINKYYLKGLNPLHGVESYRDILGLALIWTESITWSWKTLIASSTLFHSRL